MLTHPNGDDDEKLFIAYLQSPIAAGKVTLIRWGNLLEIQPNSPQSPLKNHVQNECYKRQRNDQTTFGRDQSYRMALRLAKLDQSILPLFCVLTFGFQPTQDEIKNALGRLNERLLYQFPNTAAIWKIEFGKKSRVHFHVLVWHVPRNELRIFCLKYSREVLQGNPKAVYVKSPRVWPALQKYMCKRQHYKHAPFCGKWWGVWGAEHLPHVVAETYELTNNQAQCVRDMMQEHAELAFQTETMRVFINQDSFWRQVTGVIQSP